MLNHNLIYVTNICCRCLNSNLRHFDNFTAISVLFGESCLLVSWCAGDRCGMACSNKDRNRSRKSGTEDWRWSHSSATRWPDDRDIGWSCVQSAPCTWNEKHEFLKPQNQGWWFVTGLASKPVVTTFSDLALKPVATIFCLISKLRVTV
jgi:hypothetical protein